MYWNFFLLIMYFTNNELKVFFFKMMQKSINNTKRLNYIKKNWGLKYNIYKVKYREGFAF